MTKRILAAALFLAVLPAVAEVIVVKHKGTAAAAWYDAAWRHRRQIVIDSDNDAVVPGSTAMADFPVLVQFVSDTTLDDAGNLKSDCGDVKFTASDGTTVLDHEIETCTAGSGTVRAWVRIPSLSATADTTIYMYYANAAAGAPPSPDAAWAAKFLAVYHLDSAPTAPTDSSGNANTMSATGTPTTNSTAKIGAGTTVARSSSILTVPILSSFNFDTTDLSICAWFNMSSFSPAAADYHVFSHGSGVGDTNGRYYWRVEASGANATCATGGGTCASAADCTGGNSPPCNTPRLASRLGTTNPTDDTTTTSSGVWYRACMVHNSNGGAGGTDSYSAFRDATVFTNVNNLTVTGVFTSHATADWTFGGAVHATDGFGEGMNGTLDEIWIRNVNVTGDEIAAEYNNQNNPAVGGFLVSIADSDTPTDSTAPEAIADLAASAPTASACTLGWTAPHEDGAYGGAVSSYDCRVCSQAVCTTNPTVMDDTEYGTATTLTGEPASPASPGGAESFSAGGLSASTAYVFGCKSSDGTNASAISTQSGTCTTAAGCTQAVNDDPSTYTDITTKWSSIASFLSVASNELVISSPDGNDRAAAYLTSAGSANQWIKAHIVSRSGTSQFGLAMRFGTAAYTDSAGFYVALIDFGTNTAKIEKHHWNGSSIAYDGDVTASSSTGTLPTAGTPFYLMARVTDTGAASDFEIWWSTADPGACPSDWDGAGGITKITWTNDDCGSFCVNTGSYPGLFGYMPSSANVHINSFKAGN